MSEPSSSMQEILRDVTQVFRLHGFFDPCQEAENLLCDLLNCPREAVYQEVKILEEGQAAKIKEWVERRVKGEPLAYIAQTVEFYHCRLEINPSVLIPRQETEVLVDKIASFMADRNLRGKVLWDVCCGSGCIGIALKKAFPDLTVFATDYSSKAVALAKKNAATNGVEITFFCGDLLVPMKGQYADFIVCNPPYISEEEYATLEPEVKNFEPQEALLGGPSGLEFYMRLAHDLPSVLHRGAKLWFEIGHRQGEAVKQIFSFHPWKSQEVEKDWAGHQRFFFLENE